MNYPFGVQVNPSTEVRELPRMFQSACPTDPVPVPGSNDMLVANGAGFVRYLGTKPLDSPRFQVPQPSSSTTIGCAHGIATKSNEVAVALQTRSGAGGTLATMVVRMTYDGQITTVAKDVPAVGDRRIVYLTDGSIMLGGIFDNVVHVKNDSTVATISLKQATLSIPAAERSFRALFALPNNEVLAFTSTQSLPGHAVKIKPAP